MGSGDGRGTGYRIAVSTQLLAESESDRTVLEANQKAGFVWQVSQELCSVPSRD